MPSVSQVTASLALAGSLLVGAAAQAQDGVNPPKPDVRIPQLPSGPPAQARPVPAPPESEAMKAAVERMRAYVRRPDVAALEQERVKRQVAMLPDKCPRMTFRSTRLTFLATPQFDAEGIMQAGAVRQVFTGSGCEKGEPVVNIWYFGHKDGKPRVAASFNGTSAADPKLQIDFLPQAMAAAAMAVKECKQFGVIDTRFGAFEGTSPTARPGRDARAWREDWTLRGCNHTVKVTLHFTPDATGTAGRIDTKETQVVQSL